MNTEKPIFIIGSGRSGSTAFFELLVKHPNVAWLSGLANKYKGRPRVNRLFNHLIDVPMIGPYLQRRYKPNECWDFWDNLYRGFALSFRDLTAADVTEKVKAKTRLHFSKIPTEKRHRMLIKLTGWPRIGFIANVFEDAKFVHIVRDGRAVACSLMNVDWWWGWRGPQNWRLGDLNDDYFEKWQATDRSYVSLAGLYWMIIIDAVEKTKNVVDPNNFLEVRYEDLCQDTIPKLKEVVSFCELEWSPQLEKSVIANPLRNQNNKWRQEFTAQQQQDLEDTLGPKLRQYHYL